MRRLGGRGAAFAAVLATMWFGPVADAQPDAWRELESGLEVGRFDSHRRQADPDGDLVIVRVDPRRWSLQVLQADRSPGGESRTLAEWAESHGLRAAINAGMYQADLLTHVGFAQIDGVVANGGVNDYQSAVAFDPVDAGTDPFGIFDLDETPLEELRGRYRTVLQNLRLVKRSRENRWQPLGGRWSEAALGEDAEGRALLIYCSSAWSMHDFIEILLALPIRLEAAQHLEGRSQARLWVVDAFEEGRAGRSAPIGVGGPELPSVIGVAPASRANEAGSAGRHRSP